MKFVYLFFIKVSLFQIKFFKFYKKNNTHFLFIFIKFQIFSITFVIFVYFLLNIIILINLKFGFALFLFHLLKFFTSTVLLDSTSCCFRLKNIHSLFKNIQQEKWTKKYVFNDENYVWFFCSFLRSITINKKIYCFLFDFFFFCFKRRSDVFSSTRTYRSRALFKLFAGAEIIEKVKSLEKFLLFLFNSMLYFHTNT